jgi:hypothetical protein
VVNLVEPVEGPMRRGKVGISWVLYVRLLSRLNAWQVDQAVRVLGGDLR